VRSKGWGMGDSYGVATSIGTLAGRGNMQKVPVVVYQGSSQPAGEAP